MPTTELEFADLERELASAFAVTPDEALRRRIDDRFMRAIAMAPARRRRLGWLSAAMLIGTVLLVGAGFYVALHGQPTPSALNPGQPLHCSGLIGQAPADAAATLERLGTTRSFAVADVGVQVGLGPDWPQPSSGTVSYPWHTSGRLEVDTELGPLPIVGASSDATASYSLTLVLAQGGLEATDQVVQETLDRGIAGATWSRTFPRATPAC